jgi:hypothetical protein
MNYEDGEIAEISSPIIVENNNNSNNNNDATSLQEKLADNHIIHGK